LLDSLLQEIKQGRPTKADDGNVSQTPDKK